MPRASAGLDASTALVVAPYAVSVLHIAWESIAAYDITVIEAKALQYTVVTDTARIQAPAMSVPHNHAPYAMSVRDIAHAPYVMSVRDIRYVSTTQAHTIRYVSMGHRGAPEGLGQIVSLPPETIRCLSTAQAGHTLSQYRADRTYAVSVPNTAYCTAGSTNATSQYRTDRSYAIPVPHRQAPYNIAVQHTAYCELVATPYAVGSTAQRAAKG
eukprot:1191631-Rhodomonas_salina.6